MNINSAISQGSKILRNNLISNSQFDAEILMAGKRDLKKASKQSMR